MDDSLSDSGTAPAAATTTSELPAASSLGKGRSPSTALVTSFDGPVPRTSCVRTSVFGRGTSLSPSSSLSLSLSLSLSVAL